jgi:hypothetical protein
MSGLDRTPFHEAARARRFQALSRMEQSVKCVRIRLARESGTAAPAAQHSPPLWAAPLNLQAAPSVHTAGGCRPLRAYGEVRAHIAPSKLGAATQPYGIQGPAGRRRLTFKVPRRRSTSPGAAGRFAHIVKCARILRPVSSHRNPGRTAPAVLAGGTSTGMGVYTAEWPASNLTRLRISSIISSAVGRRPVCFLE